MVRPFGVSSTTDEVLAGVDLQGRRALVTGTSAGLGVEIARALAACGADVVGATRDLTKAARATIDVQRAARMHGRDFELIGLDLASFASTRACADQLMATGKPLDIIIANAGVMATPFGRTIDGFETQFATNHLGHFLFINRIASLIPGGGRLVSVSSAGHHIADVDIDDPNFDRTKYDPFISYGRSKTANILFAVEFDRRHRDRGVRACATHPGAIFTELGRHMDDVTAAALAESLEAARAGAGLPPLEYKTIPQGAATTVWAAAVADAETVGGRYCEDCHVSSITDAQGFTGVRNYALDPEHALALWAESERLIGERF